MKIDIKLLKSITYELFNNMESKGIENIPLDSDYYWSIPIDEIYNVYNNPSELTIGQLTEDYNMLVKSYENKDLITYDLKKLSPLLTYLSQRYPM